MLDHERCLGSLRVRVAVPAGVSPQQVGVRLWQQGSGIGVRLVPTASTKTVAAFGRDHIPADHYRLELYCPAFGVVDAGTHWLDGTSRVVLDHLALPEPAHVTFALPPGEPTPAADAFELVRVGVAVDCRLLTGRPFAGPHLLGPGRYAIWWRDGTGTVRSHPFSVVTAGTLAVDLPR